MQTTDPNTLGATPFYKSPVFISLVTSAVSAIIAKFPSLGKYVGITDTASAEAVVNGIFSVIAIIAPMVGTVLRVRSKIQPLTVTQTQADNHPATAVASQRSVPPTTKETP